MGTSVISVETAQRLATLGNRIRTARQRRGWTLAETAARAGLNRNTLGTLEQGKPGAAIGAYATVLWVFGLDRSLDAVADPNDDSHGKALEEARRRMRIRKHVPREAKAGKPRFSQQALDEHKRTLALAIVSRCTPREIRSHSLANLERWKSQGAWVSTYDEWQSLLSQDDDGALFAAMLGRDERANRLRQSPPYAGLLSREELRKLDEEAVSAAQRKPPASPHPA